MGEVEIKSKFFKKRFGFAIILLIVALVLCFSLQFNEFYSILISLLFSITGTIILCSFNLDFSFNLIGMNIKPLSKNAAILCSFIFLFITNQAFSFPSVIHNTMASIGENINIKQVPQKIIVDSNDNEKKQEIDKILQDLVLQYENLKITKNVKKNKSIIIKFVDDRLVYLRDKSVTTNNDIKNYNIRYINATNRKISLEKNVILIQQRLNNYNSKKDHNYLPPLPYAEFREINREDVTPNYLIVEYSLQQFQNIITNSNLTAADFDKLDLISLKIKNQFDKIDIKIRPIINEINHREKLLDNKESMQLIIENRLTMLNY